MAQTTQDASFGPVFEMVKNTIRDGDTNWFASMLGDVVKADFEGSFSRFSVNVSFDFS
jgi:hypothetical protein